MIGGRELSTRRSFLILRKKGDKGGELSKERGHGRLNLRAESHLYRCWCWRIKDMNYMRKVKSSL